MTATKVWWWWWRRRDTGTGRVLGGWAPLLCLLAGALMALVLPRVGVGDQDGCCAALRGVALLRCQVWGSSQRHAVRSTGLTVPFTALDILPYRAKPSRGRGSMHTCTVCLTPYCEVLILSWIKHASLKIGYQENIFT